MQEVSVQEPSVGVPFAQGPSTRERSASGTASGSASGAVDERIELSGAVTVNWAAKAAGLLADEGIAPGDAVHVDLPAHWLSLSLALGALCAGATLSAGPSPVRSGGSGGSGAAMSRPHPAPAAVLTDRPEDWTDPSAAVLAVVLPRGLAPEFGGEADLKPGVVDVAAEIRAQPDALPGPVDHVRPDMLDDALEGAGTEAVPAEAEAADAESRPRLSLADVREALRAWDAGQPVTIPA